MIDPFGSSDPMENVLSLQSLGEQGSVENSPATVGCTSTWYCGDTWGCGSTGWCGYTASCGSTGICSTTPRETEVVAQ